MPVMTRTLALITAVLLFSVGAWAQEPAQAEPPKTESPISSATPVVRFVFDWRAQDPPRYSVAVDATGRATYRSEPSANPNGGVAPEPYQVEWTATEATRTKIFDDARRLNYFDGNFASKAKVAQTGVKTLSYKDPSRDHSTSYNYSENPSIRELTQTFQGMATTAEAGRRLTHDLRYDKLGIDRDLKTLQESQKNGFAVEFGSVLPILQQIADDPAVMRMSQQRARQILAAAGFSTSGTAKAARP
jgi:hypothetical protein